MEDKICCGLTRCAWAGAGYLSFARTHSRSACPPALYMFQTDNETQERGIGHEYVCHLRAVQCTSRLGSRADTSARPWRQKWPGIAFTGLGSSPPQMAMALTSRGQSPASPASPLACCPHGPCLDRGYWLQGFRCLKTLKWHWRWCWRWHWHCVFEHLYAMNTPVWRWYIPRLV